MKRKFTAYLIIIVAICSLKFNAATAQVNVKDSLTLVDLYNSTNGPMWYNHTNWLTNAPVSTWYGITVSENRVSDIVFYNNNLSDSLPNSLGNLTSLQSLVIVLNDSLKGKIPVSLGNLVNLQTLQLASNHFKGTIPSSLGKLNKLTGLSLVDNGLSGSIPSSLEKLLRLQLLDLSNNYLTGKIPPLKNTNLQQILLYNNHLSGSIPSSLGKLQHLQILQLNNNDLSGKIPDSITNLNAAVGIYLEHNRLTFAGLEKPVKKFPGIIYSPQANISIIQNGNVLSVSAGGTLANNTYKWYKNGVLFKTKTGNARLTVNGSGNYSVNVTNSVATALTLYSDTVFYAGFNAIAFSQADKKNNFLIITAYPNPASKIVTLLFNASGKYSLAITDVSGKTLQTKTGIAIKGTNVIQLNINKYASGVYFITIIDEKNNRQTLRLSKE
jgi:Leucine-rich repeat (LRR) protein